MPRSVRIDLTGQRFGRWVVVSYDRYCKGCSLWLCSCDCGVKKVVNGTSLRTGKSRSCGCFLREVSRNNQYAKKHGHTAGRWIGQPRTPEYVTWQSMLARCYYPKAKRYERYGGRGIEVCERWRHSFENFLFDMGLKPEKGYTLDRFPDNNGNYEPENCRWATAKQQANNRSKCLAV